MSPTRNPRNGRHAADEGLFCGALLRHPSVKLKSGRVRDVPRRPVEGVRPNDALVDRRMRAVRAVDAAAFDGLPNDTLPQRSGRVVVERGVEVRCLGNQAMNDERGRLGRGDDVSNITRDDAGLQLAATLIAEMNSDEAVDEERVLDNRGAHVNHFQPLDAPLRDDAGETGFRLSLDLDGDAAREYAIGDRGSTEVSASSATSADLSELLTEETCAKSIAIDEDVDRVRDEHVAMDRCRSALEENSHFGALVDEVGHNGKIVEAFAETVERAS